MSDSSSIMEVKDGRLIINIPLMSGEASASGKSVVYASTHGPIQLNDGFVLGLNLYKSKKGSK